MNDPEMSSDQASLPPRTEKRTTADDKSDVYEEDEENHVGGEDSKDHEAAGKGSWKHAAFHVATTIATPAAYAPLPFALASLGWPLGE